MSERDLFPGFDALRLRGATGELFCRVGGEGPPLLLLHGYPQTHAAWHRVAPGLARHFRCVVADLPGYGASFIPTPTADHAAYSKRAMARELVAAMAELGHQRFSVIGHDRGARVAYRLALDAPERIERLGILEVVPTAQMWDSFNAEMAMKAYHWTFLAQPHPLPERMIAADPVAYVEWTLASWSQSGSLGTFDPLALEAYRRAFAEPERIRAFCEDYRAGATMDRALDEADRKAGRRIKPPLHFVWSHNGFPARTGKPLALWEEWAEQVSGEAVEGGHFLPEENPDAVLRALVPFFRGG
ncbi:alpha/beta hydrolase [Chelativorans sp.]|uniref:alpha/beta fold hydrolase n=1 Tax=Chelativorans sp. TaxID=2203393 RepID=UPI0028114BE3|nr:alpha/beta hydrolase [Chelativorans sp.]